MKKLLFALALAFAPAPVFAEAAPVAVQTAPVPNADPALWVVRDEDTNIYLFGTFHMLDGRRDWFNDEVRAAFDRADELVMEALLPDDPAAIQPLVMRYAIDLAGPPLSERLSAEQNEALASALGGMGIPAAAFERFKPWFAALTLGALGAQRLGLEAEHGPETILTAAARERGMPIGELEGMEAQFRMLAGMGEEQQITQLGLAIDQFERIPEMLAPMLAAWLDGDVDGLVAIMNAQIVEHPELYRLMFSDRNAAWAEWIAERMERPGTVFLAVGAGHLAGPDSVQDLLAARGMAAERVQ